MKHARLLRPHIRRRLAWLVVVMLLWQQMAVAAYACTTVPASSRAAALVTSSSMTMGNDCAHMQAASADPTCHQHCQPDRTTQAEARTASVPPNALLALPPTPTALSMTTVALPTRGALVRFDRQHAPPPDPRWLFCTLLI